MSTQFQNHMSSWDCHIALLQRCHSSWNERESDSYHLEQDLLCWSTVVEGNDQSDMALYPCDERGVLSIEHFIASHPDSFIPCNPRPKHYQYCQMHYLVTWDSKKRLLERYKKSSYHHKTTDISIVTHSSQGLVCFVISSVSRLHYLKDLLERWSGYILSVLFIIDHYPWLSLQNGLNSRSSRI